MTAKNGRQLEKTVEVAEEHHKPWIFPAIQERISFRDGDSSGWIWK
jgi:hypothetical protein